MAKTRSDKVSRDRRRERALKRQEARAGLSAAQQLGRLQDAGHGRCKEAKRLEEMIVKEVEE